MQTPNHARILRLYGRALETFQYSLGREDCLPCDKESLRACLILAMAMSRDEETRRSLRDGYVLLEAFLPRHEYEAVRTFEKHARELRHVHRGISAEALHEMTREASDAHALASRIQMRVASQMLARKRDLSGVS